MRTNPHTVAVHDVGVEEGRAILAVPGLGLAADMFIESFTELANSWSDEPLRLVGVNRPGLDSPPCTCSDSHSLTDVAMMHIQVADALGIDRFDLVGHSLGGPVILKIADLVPHRVRTIFVIDGAVYGAFLPSRHDGEPDSGVMRINSEVFAEQFGAVRPAPVPTGIAIKGEHSWPSLPDDPLGGWRPFSQVWARSYRRIIAPYLGAVLIQTSLGHWMHSSWPESVGQGRFLRGNPWALAQFHASVLRAHYRDDLRVRIPAAALEAAGAHIAYEPHGVSDEPRDATFTLASLRKFRGVYVPMPQVATSGSR